MIRQQYCGIGRERSRAGRATRPSVLVGRVHQTLRGLYLAYVEYQSRRALHALLRSLPDRTLRDIGIDRDGIDAAVSCALEGFRRHWLEQKEVPGNQQTRRFALQHVDAIASQPSVPALDFDRQPVRRSHPKTLEVEKAS